MNINIERSTKGRVLKSMEEIIVKFKRVRTNEEL